MGMNARKGSTAIPMRAAFAAIVLFATVHAAHAAIFPDDEARRRIEATNIRLSQLEREMQDRLAALEQQVKGGGLADLANQIQLLQSDVAKLRGQIEVVTYELEQAQKRQRDLYVDLDTRLRKLETAAATPPQTTEPPMRLLRPRACQPNLRRRRRPHLH